MTCVYALTLHVRVRRAAVKLTDPDNQRMSYALLVNCKSVCGEATWLLYDMREACRKDKSYTSIMCAQMPNSKSLTMSLPLHNG